VRARARLAATLNHPHVVRSYDLGQEGVSFYIAMEFIAGHIGNRKLGTTPLAPREVYEGSYMLRLVNSELGAIKTKKVVVEPGRTTVVREQME
jgi:hypothetical protein